MCVYEYTHHQLERNHESKDAKRYTHQTQTVKPAFMSDTIASVTELIAAGHGVVVPHVVGVRDPPALLGQALCGIQDDKIHVSLTGRDEGNWKHDRT